jgi:alkaline phosphatase D
MADSAGPAAEWRAASRRRFLLSAAGSAATAALGAACQPVRQDGEFAPLSAPGPSGRIFSLGVASGEPEPDRIVLWTRLAPDPLNGGGMPDKAVTVAWELAEDEGLRRIVRRGEAIATAAWAHSLHVEVTGLEPARWYWYRFMALGEASPVGRTRTAPDPAAEPRHLAFAAAACQHYEHNFFTAYQHLAAEALDFVLHLGDYIYEGAPRDEARNVRRHIGGTARSLADYRNRYALYKSDPDLQLAHAAFPWLAIWDDHEVENDYAGAVSGGADGEARFLRRRAAAYRAYFEHMPLSPRRAPTRTGLALYRGREFGRLLNLVLLDGRQHRARQACAPPGRGGGQTIRRSACAELDDGARSLLGEEQERWLARQLLRAPVRWTCIAQQLLIASLGEPVSEPDPEIWTDGWDGYAPARRRLLGEIAATRLGNVVALGGDIHSFWATDLKLDFARPGSPTVASEFVVGSIASHGLAPVVIEAARRLPHIRYAEGRVRGYLRCTVTPSEWISEFRALAAPRLGAMTSIARFAVTRGRPGAEIA